MEVGVANEAVDVVPCALIGIAIELSRATTATQANKVLERNIVFWIFDGIFKAKSLALQDMILVDEMKDGKLLGIMVVRTKVRILAVSLRQSRRSNSSRCKPSQSRQTPEGRGPSGKIVKVETRRVQYTANVKPCLLALLPYIVLERTVGTT